MYKVFSIVLPVLLAPFTYSLVLKYVLWPGGLVLVARSTSEAHAYADSVTEAARWHVALLDVHVARLDRLEDTSLLVLAALLCNGKTKKAGEA